MRSLVDTADVTIADVGAPAIAHDGFDACSASVVPVDDFDLPGIPSVARVDSRRNPADPPETQDAAFGEDAACSRQESALQDLTIVRKLALRPSLLAHMR